MKAASPVQNARRRFAAIAVAACAGLLFAAGVGCSNHTSATPAGVSVSANPSSGIGSFQSEFKAQVTGGTPVSWAWDWGDATKSSAAYKTWHYFREPGTYDVSVAVTLADGRVALGNYTIVVDKPAERSAPASTTATFAEAYPKLFEGFSDAVTREGFDTIDVPGVKSYTVQISASREWVKNDLLARESTLVSGPTSNAITRFKQLALTAGAKLVERSQLAGILQEIELGTNDAFNQETAARFGQLTTAKAFVFLQMEPAFEAVKPLTIGGTRFQIRATYRLSARLVDVEKGQIAWLGVAEWADSFAVPF